MEDIYRLQQQIKQTREKKKNLWKRSVKKTLLEKQSSLWICITAKAITEPRSFSSQATKTTTQGGTTENRATTPSSRRSVTAEASAATSRPPFRVTASIAPRTSTCRQTSKHRAGYHWRIAFMASNPRFAWREILLSPGIR